MSQVEDSKRDLLRHCLATLAYRAGKATRGAPERFADYRPAEGSRTAGQILAHLADLFRWALSIAQGRETWDESAPLAWDEGVARFFDALAAFDSFVASDADLGATPERLFQGPIADAFTHVGQIAMLRRMAGGPVKGENYSRAEITAGRVGPDQAAPKREF